MRCIRNIFCISDGKNPSESDLELLQVARALMGASGKVCTFPPDGDYVKVAYDGAAIAVNEVLVERYSFAKRFGLPLEEPIELGYSKSELAELRKQLKLSKLAENKPAEASVAKKGDELAKFVGNIDGKPTFAQEFFIELLSNIDELDGVTTKFVLEEYRDAMSRRFFKVERRVLRDEQRRREEKRRREAFKRALSERSNKGGKPSKRERSILRSLQELGGA